jgi:MFS superfamily sulfate permease-like transporter
VAAPVSAQLADRRRHRGVHDLGLLIPEMIAYASLTGLPPQAGLYTLLASLALCAVFGTSRHLVVAGTSASAVLVFSAVTALGPKDAHSYATLAAGMIIVTGLIFIVAGLLKLGSSPRSCRGRSWRASSSGWPSS